MVFPFLVILPGLIAISVPPRPAVLPQEQGAALTQGRGRGLIVDQLDPAPGPGDAAPTQVRGKGLIPVKINETSGKPELDNDGKPKLDYNLAIPNMLLHYFPTGMLGLGLTALLASFMSGMAGNVTAFNTVWTFDIYAAYLKPNASDHHYLWMGRFTTIFGIAISVAAAYFARNFENIMNLLQLVFAFVNAPLLATFLLGMFWKRTTGHGAFLGLVAGTLAAVLHHGLALPARETVGPKGGWFGVWHVYPQELGMNFWTAIFAWTTCFVVTIAVSLFTRPREDKDLVGLVYSLTPKPSEAHVAWYARPAFLGVVVLVIAILLNIIFM
jgi:SSS family solute:Na+ symporter